MSNGIGMRQNDEKAIVMLAAQRQLYRNARKYNQVYLTLSVWIPFILAGLYACIPESIKYKYILYIVYMIDLCADCILDRNIDEKKELAAFIQQKFDVYVYQMPWDKKIFGKEKNVDHEVAIYSKKILDNQKEKEKLKDWYISEADNKTLLEGILSCQRENLGWDVGLRKRFKNTCVILRILIILAILLIGLYKNENIIELFIRFVFLFPILKWLSNTHKKLNKDIKVLKELDADINDNKIKTMEDLQDIQKLIFYHRKECYVIPECIYKLFKDNDEDIAYRCKC